MLNINEKQLKIFDDLHKTNFEKEMIVHIKTEFPEQIIDLSDKNLHEIVSLAELKSEQYGFNERVDICQYINLMMLFDPNFDVKLKWASDILNSDYEQSGTAKMLELYEEAMNHSE